MAAQWWLVKVEPTLPFKDLPEAEDHPRYYGPFQKEEYADTFVGYFDPRQCTAVPVKMSPPPYRTSKGKGRALQPFMKPRVT